MRKDREHKEVCLYEAVKYLGFCVPEKLDSFINFLCDNSIEFQTVYNSCGIGFYVREYYLEFKKHNGTFIFSNVYEWRDRDQNPLATKIAEVLNSMKGVILSDSDCKDIEFYTNTEEHLLIDGLEYLECKLPAITMYTYQIKKGEDFEESGHESNVSISLVPVYGMPVILQYSSFKKAGISWESYLSIAQVIADLTQKEVKITIGNKLSVVAPISEQEARLKYYYKQMKPSNSF